MAKPITVDEQHPANAGVLRHLTREWTTREAGASVGQSPEEVEDPYYNLGTHPELVTRLWDELTVELPVLCRWVVGGSPALVRPDTGVVFGFAQGTPMYALLLPEAIQQEALPVAIAKAQRLADEQGLAGEQREKYLRIHAGRVWEYPGGETLDLCELGPGWTFGRFLEQETRWCRAAYEHAI